MDTEELPETPFERFVLLAVADLAEEGEAPVHSFDVRERCTAHTAEVTCAEGGVERSAVLGALETLVEHGALNERETTSPVGKGRPGYELTADPETVVDGLATDDAVGDYAASLQG